MNSMKHLLLGSAALLATAGTAQATDLYGNGATLPSQVVRQAEDCYGTSEQLAVKQVTGNTFVNPPPATIPGTANNCDQNASKVDPTASIFYVSTGSGDGIRSVYRNDGVLAGDYLPAAGIQNFPKLHYGVSETSLGATDVNAYNNGGTVQGVTVVAPGVTPTAGVNFKNPNEFYGPLVQFPLLIAPVTIAYDPVYKKVRNGDGTVTEYTFNINGGRPTGGLKLNQATYCRIFNGQLTNWRELQKANGGSLKDPDDPATRFSVPLQIVGRSDSSGTTSLWTRHLAAACASTVGNQYAGSTSTLPASLQGPVYDPAVANAPVSGETRGKYTRAPGNEGVSKYVDFSRNPKNKAGSTLVQGRMAYLSADFVLPASQTTGSNNFNLHTADLKNASGRFVAPTPETAIAAFGRLSPPDSASNGAYDPASSDPRSRANPQDWVEAASAASALANPLGRTAYPIVGTSNFLGYTCYATDAERAELVDFLTWYETGAAGNVVNDPTQGILALSGFAPLPTEWRRAIRETFLTPVPATAGLGLQIKTAGQSGVCQNKQGAAN
jgi:phosphate transport system substrate-binding protein